MVNKTETWNVKMKCIIIASIAVAISSIGKAETQLGLQAINLEANRVRVTIPRLEDKRLTYTNNSKMWMFFSVKNTDRPGKGFYSNISQEGSVTILNQNKTLEELALEEIKMHGRNYSSVKNDTLNDVGKLLIYEDKSDKKLVERRVFLWWIEGDATMKLDFTYMDFTARSAGKKGRQFVMDSLMGLRVNDKPVPMIKEYLEILGD